MEVIVLAQTVMAALIAKQLMRNTIYVTIAAIGVAVNVPAITVGTVIIAINATDMELHIMPIRENVHANPVIAVMTAKPKTDCFLV